MVEGRWRYHPVPPDEEQLFRYEPKPVSRKHVVRVARQDLLLPSLGGEVQLDPAALDWAGMQRARPARPGQFDPMGLTARPDTGTDTIFTTRMACPEAVCRGEESRTQEPSVCVYVYVCVWGEGHQRVLKEIVAPAGASPTVQSA